jgi:hypothetical protein
VAGSRPIRQYIHGRTRKDKPPPKLSRLDEARQIIEEYAASLRELSPALDLGLMPVLRVLLEILSGGGVHRKDRNSKASIAIKPAINNNEVVAAIIFALGLSFQERRL